MKFYAILILLVLNFLKIYASNQDSIANEISADDLKRHLSVIASDGLEGRNTGTYGQFLAGEYISNLFDSLNLQPIVNSPIGKSYYQKVDLVKTNLKSVSLSSSSKSFTFMHDFYFLSLYHDTGINLETVFVGYGIESEIINEYEGKDVQGKLAIILMGEPKYDNGKNLITDSDAPSIWGGPFAYSKKAAIAKKRGAKAILFLYNDEDFHEKAKSNYNKIYTHKYLLPDNRDLNNSDSRSSGIFMRESLIKDICGIELKDLIQYKRAILNKKILNLEASQKVYFKTEYELEPVPTANVLGYLPGDGSTNETVVITSHYDHIGRNETEIFNGADDDGSGTVSVLEIAQAFAYARDKGHIMKRNILFMTVTGEEKGLLGSRYFTDFEPIIPLKDIVCNLNIDMVGRIDDDHLDSSNYVYTIGSDRLTPELKALQESVNAKTVNLQLDYSYDGLDDPNNFYKRSDHYNFAKNNIPVVFYFNGSHDDYHQSTDTIEKINYELMAKRAKLIFYTAWEIANMPERFNIEKN